MRCWGNNSYGQLGDNNAPNDSAVIRAPLLSDVQAMGLGAEHTCAVVGPGGNVRCWGRNASGQLGDGGKQDLWTPTGPEVVRDASRVVAGLDHTCALLSNGRVKCWGQNTYGALGDGTRDERLTPVDVPGFCP